MKTPQTGLRKKAFLSGRRAVGYLLFGAVFLSLTGWWFIAPSTQSALPPGLTLTTVVAGRDLSPLGGVFDSDGTPALGLGVSRPTTTGEMAFFAFGTGGSARQAIFRSVGNRIIPVVAVGDPTPLDGTFSFFFPPAYNQVGDIAFGALVKDGTAPQGVFLVSGGRITKIIAVTDLTPLGEVSALLSPPALNNQGEVVFKVALAGPQSRPGILRAAGGQISKVAEEGDVTPLGERLSLGVHDSFPLALNDAGDVAFSTPQGVFLVSRVGSLTQLVAVGDPTPLGGTFAAFTPPSINNVGAVAFGATIANGAVAQGVFLATPGQITTIVADGDLAPVGGTLALAVGASSPPLLNNRGEVAFSVSIPQGSPADELPPLAGVFLSSSGRITKVVTDGDPSPLGGIFISGYSFLLSDTGTMLFMGIVDTTGDGNPDNQGIFAAQALAL